MLRRLMNRFAKLSQAPGNAISLLRCVSDIRSLNDNTDIQSLADFCFRYAIRPLQEPDELIRLFEVVSKLQAKTVMEIGTYNGGTLFMTCRVCGPDATIISVDMSGGKFDHGYVLPRKYVYRRFTKKSQNLHLLRRDSHDPKTADLVQSMLRGVPLDFLLIDGDYTYDGVRADFEMYAPLVRNGGIIAFHDIVKHAPHVECDVDRFWAEIKLRYRHTEIIKDPSQGWAGIGVLQM